MKIQVKAKRLFSIFVLTLLLALSTVVPIYAADGINPSGNDTINGKNYVDYLDAEKLASVNMVDFSNVCVVQSTPDGKYIDTEGYIKVYSGGAVRAKFLPEFIEDIQNGKIVPDLIIPVYESEEKTDMFGYIPLVFDETNKRFVSPTQKYNDFSSATMLLLSSLIEESEIDGVRINTDKAVVMRYLYMDNYSCQILYNEIDGEEYYIDLNGSAVKNTGGEIKSYTPEEYIAKRTEIEKQISNDGANLIFKTIGFGLSRLIKFFALTIVAVFAVVVVIKLLIKRKKRKT